MAPLILVDANILIYAYAGSVVQHRRAREWLDDQLNGPTPVGLPWPSLLAFLRVITNPRIFERPESMGESMGVAWQQVMSWLAGHRVWVPGPTERHAEIVGDLLSVPGTRGNLVSDAHMAALALEHGLLLCSCDSDFLRFSRVRWLNPLTGQQNEPARP